MRTRHDTCLREFPPAALACAIGLALLAAAPGCGSNGAPPAIYPPDAATTGAPPTSSGAGPDGGGGAAPDASRGPGPDRSDTTALPDAAADAATDGAPDATAGDAPATGGDARADAAVSAGAVSWAIDNLTSIAGHPTTVLGAPVVIETPGGKALQFDGADDALFVETHPLAGLPQFTVELYFRPDPGGVPAQRFFHMQEEGSGGRVLFETRVFDDARWALDVFIESAAGEVAVYDARKVHPLGAWYHLAAVVDGQRARSYVNGVEQASFPLAFRAHQGGRTSIGVRITRMYFFKGAIRAARFTPRVLTPAEFLPPS